MAERSPRSTPPINTPFTTDHPPITQHPQAPSSTVLSAPTTTAPAASQQQSSQTTLSSPAPDPRSRRAPSTTTTTTSAVFTHQILGRRRRASSDHDFDHLPEGATSSPAAHNPADSRRSKRRRTDSMSADGDGEASSNGISRGITTEPRTSHRSFPVASTNGTHKASASSANGSSMLNGKGTARDPPPSYFGHDREEVTRILIQTLSDMGYQSAAETVSRDSGYELESHTVAAFRSAVINGRWDEAERLLFGASTAGEGPNRSGNGLVLSEEADRDGMRFCIRQQKFLELLEQRDYRQALNVLRTELTPLDQDSQKLHFLSSLLMCQSPDDVKSKAEWDGAHGESRRTLLSQLSSTRLPPPLCLLIAETLADSNRRVHITICHAA